MLVLRFPVNRLLRRRSANAGSADQAVQPQASGQESVAPSRHSNSTMDLRTAQTRGSDEHSGLQQRRRSSLGVVIAHRQRSAVRVKSTGCNQRSNRRCLPTSTVANAAKPPRRALTAIVEVTPERQLYRRRTPWSEELQLPVFSVENLQGRRSVVQQNPLAGRLTLGGSHPETNTRTIPADLPTGLLCSS